MLPVDSTAPASACTYLISPTTPSELGEPSICVRRASQKGDPGHQDSFINFVKGNHTKSACLTQIDGFPSSEGVVGHTRYVQALAEDVESTDNIF